MNKLLLGIFTGSLMLVTGINVLAADKEAAASNEDEEKPAYEQVATACQSQITPKMVPDAKQRQEQIDNCVEKGITASIEGGE